MYIIEIITKFITRTGRKKQMNQQEQSSEDYEICRHVYIPIDSTMDYLACNNCGHVIKNEKKNVGPSNFFLNK